MNKTELITAMAEASGLTKKDCDTALNAFVDTLQTALKSGDKVQLLGFGTFEVKERAARTGKNPPPEPPLKSPLPKRRLSSPATHSRIPCSDNTPARDHLSRAFSVIGAIRPCPWHDRHIPAPLSYPCAPRARPHG